MGPFPAWSPRSGPEKLQAGKEGEGLLQPDASFIASGMGKLHGSLLPAQVCGTRRANNLFVIFGGRCRHVERASG